MNIKDTSEILLFIQVLCVIVVVYCMWKICGYILCKILTINCEKNLYAIIGFFGNILIYFVLMVIYKVFSFSYSNIPKAFLLVLAFFLIISIYILYRNNSISIKDIINDNESIVFIGILSVFQVILMVITIDASSYEKTTWIVETSKQIDNGYNIYGNVILGLHTGQELSAVNAFDLYVYGISKILWIHPWIMYHFVMSVFKILFNDLIIYSFGKKIFFEQKKVFFFTIVSLLIELMMYYGGTEISPTYLDCIGESIYGFSSNSYVYIHIVAIPLLYYVIFNYQKENSKNEEKLLVLIATIISCINYVAAILTIVIVSAFLFARCLLGEKIISNTILLIKSCVVSIISIIVISFKFTITHFLYFSDLYKDIWKNNYILIISLGVMSIFLLLKKEKYESVDRIIKDAIVVPSIMIALLLMNPIVTKFTGKFGGYINIQDKIWWCIPCVYILAYGTVAIYEQVGMNILYELVVLVIVTVHLLYGRSWQSGYSQERQPLENIDKLSQINLLLLDNTSIEIARFLSAYDEANENKKIYVPHELTYRLYVCDQNLVIPYAEKSFIMHNTLSRDEALLLYESGEKSAMEVAGSYYTDIPFDEIERELVVSDVEYVIWGSDANINDDVHGKDAYLSEINCIDGYKIFKMCK